MLTLINQSAWIKRRNVFVGCRLNFSFDPPSFPLFDLFLFFIIFLLFYIGEGEGEGREVFLFPNMA